MLMDNINKCIVCGQHNPNGIMVREKYICPACEDKIVALTVDHPDYNIIKESLKQIWISSDTEGLDMTTQ